MKAFEKEAVTTTQSKAFVVNPAMVNAVIKEVIFRNASDQE
jgi:hypothetical protein